MARETAQARRVRVAMRKLEPEIRKAFEKAIAQAAFAIDRPALVAALEAGQVERAIELLRINQAVMFPLGESIRGSFMAGGALVSDDLPRGMSGRFGFDGRHLRAEAWVSQHGATLIQGIEAETLEVARTVITEGLSAGRSSKAVARDLTGRKVGKRRVGGFLGLNSDQTDQVIRARHMLSDPDQIRGYFIKDRKTGRMKPRYKLSDRRFDKMVKDAIKEGRGLTASELDKVSEAHRSKALGYRGKVIAKDQAHTAMAAGRDEGFRQVMEDPEVETVTVRWQHNLSLVPREDHQAMDGTVIEYGETFDFADASMKHPHDPSGGAKHSVGCRCIAMYRVKFRRD